MEAFPGRMVCISSATLGVHLWQRLLLSTTPHMHDLIASRVRATGVVAEVYSDPSKPFRRPFGRDYRTITPHGILTSWRDQFAYYLDDDRQIPDFPTVVRAFIEVVDAEVAMAKKAATTFDGHGRHGMIDFMAIAERLTVVEGWLRAGCPEWQEPEENVEEPWEEGEAGEQAQTDEQHGFSYSVPSSPSGQTPHLRSGEWAKGLEYLTIHGLQEPDSVGTVLYEMATFLCWVELFDLLAGERERRIVDLLTAFVRTRHNGLVDRLNGGREHEVVRQVGQAVRAVVKNRYAGCLEHFARIRQRRDQGRYSHVIDLVPLIEGEGQGQPDNTPWFSYSVVFSRDDSTAPEAIEATLGQVARSSKMRRRNGEYPFVRFARRLLNVLWASRGHARINRDDLLSLSDSGDTHQLVEYRRLLVEAGVLAPYRGTYRAGTAATLYRTTEATRRAYEARHEALSRPCAG